MSQAICSLGLDADAILTALDEGNKELDPLKAMDHVTTCPACKEVVRLRALSRSLFFARGLSSFALDKTRARKSDRDMVTEDLRRRWEARERRAARPHRGSFTFAGGSLRTALAFAALPLAVALVVVVVVKRNEAPLEVAKDAPSTVASFVTAPPEVSRREADPRTPKGEAARSLTVPDGSHVTLGFAIPGSAELIGPATAETTDTSITLRRGLINLRELRSIAVHLPSGAKVDPNGAVCSVDVDERGAARVKVTSGHPIVHRAGGVTQMSPGASLEIANASSPSPPTPAPTTTLATLPPTPPVTTAPPHEEAPAAPTSPDAVVRREALAATIAGGSSAAPVSPEDALATARARLRSGDAMGARTDLEKLASSSDEKTARRASFTLAEMDLAPGAPGGDRARAHARLRDLVVCPEPALGADAATLLARSLGAPAERADVWRRYLGTHPSAPHLDRARLARAEALLDAGQIVDARVLLEDVKKSPSLSEPQKSELERLQFKARELH